MFTKTKNNRVHAWFPGQKPTLDRWGQPISGTVAGHEFQAEPAVAGAVERMRWSLGLA